VNLLPAPARQGSIISHSNPTPVVIESAGQNAKKNSDDSQAEVSGGEGEWVEAIDSALAPPWHDV
jgi:hypothetical protein